MTPFRSLFCLLLLLPLLVACGSEPTTAPPPPALEATDSTGLEDGVDRAQLASELYFYNWGDFIDMDTLAQFEAEYGVRVIYDLYDSNEDMIAQVRTGNSGYDIVVPSDYAVQMLIEEGLLQPLELERLDNLRHIDPDYLNTYFDPGNRYSVPYMFGLTGIVYNREFFPEGVESWAALFDPAQLEAIRGRFSMLDDERETPGAALKYLGYSYNTTEPEALQQAQELLITQKPFLAAYNSADVNRKMASGEYVIAHSWSGSAMQARLGLEGEFSGNPAINFVIPQEGGAIWMDNLAILSESANAYTAHVFINFLLRPEIAAQNADYVGYITPNEAAIPLMSEEVQALYAAGFAPDDALLTRLEWIERTEATAVFSDLWTVVKGE
ncbi:polyamine ABC transporter substrate-binding protein [Candidatus Viridilinea mediisalina]|uniref:ABC transporter substrate-binding protein n=1 Tax=Candidatus Viridilinea mediisalina TaxID=2024553 RepID=A0A2A6RL04_9CHLR|nr:spermidine/putrescine ABC transporter substrate-binding protein [Candidatus Viridilinea mediisalina]PDW03613.1 ABC transporter substrate-binding protein [Candidatus Viridilinea mediisalina]